MKVPALRAADLRQLETHIMRPHGSMSRGAGAAGGGARAPDLGHGTARVSMRASGHKSKPERLRSQLRSVKEPGGWNFAPAAPVPYESFAGECLC